MQLLHTNKLIQNGRAIARLSYGINIFLVNGLFFHVEGHPEWPVSDYTFMYESLAADICHSFNLRHGLATELEIAQHPSPLPSVKTIVETSAVVESFNHSKVCGCDLCTLRRDTESVPFGGDSEMTFESEIMTMED